MLFSVLAVIMTESQRLNYVKHVECGIRIGNPYGKMKFETRLPDSIKMSVSEIGQKRGGKATAA